MYSRTGHHLKVVSYRKGLVVGEQRYWTRVSEKARPRPGPRPMRVGAAARILHYQGWVHSCHKESAPAFPAKDPVRPPPVPARHLLLLSKSSSTQQVQATSPSANPAPLSSHLPPCCVVLCRIVSCRNLPVFPSTYTSFRSQILSALNQTQQKKECPHLFRLPFETAPLTDHRDTIIFPPVRHRALRVRTKLSVPSHPRPDPRTLGRVDTQADILTHSQERRGITCSPSKASLLYLLRHPHGWTESRDRGDRE